MFSGGNNLTTTYLGHLTQYEVALHEERLSPHTRRNYLTQIRQFLFFAQSRGFDSELLLADPAIREFAIEMYRFELKQSMNASSGSINTVLATIRHFCRLKGVDMPLALREPNRNVERKVLPLEDLDRIIAVLREPMLPIHSKDRAIVALFLFAGLRLKECIDLNLEDVVPTADGFEFLIRSDFEQRVVPLPAHACGFFSPWWEDRNANYFHATAALFLNKHGTRISASGFDSIVRKVGLRARVVLSARMLRNTCIKRSG